MSLFNKRVMLTDFRQTVGTGWLFPTPDLRDYSPDSPKLKDINEKIGFKAGDNQTLPAKIDLKQWCSCIEDQLQLGSCTANAAAGIVEYFELRANKKYIDASRLFIYKNTRNLMQVTGDTGAWLRTTMSALALCGVAPEKYWAYTDSDPEFDNQPPSFVYSIADNYEALKYFCHDSWGKRSNGIEILNSVKKYLAAGIPSMFGFFGFPSFNETDTPGGIPYPCQNEQSAWGHAIVAVGYDDSKNITNKKYNLATKGALLIRNSWGTSWGEEGYGWLPYDYVLNGLALDFWSLLSMQWVDTGTFGINA